MYDLRKLLPLGKKFTVEIGEDGISKGRMYRINNLIYSGILMPAQVQIEPEAVLPADFSPAWETRGGEYQGKIAKRIEKYLKVNHKVKLTPQQTSQIGNWCDQLRVRPEKYVFDFDDHFNWNAGDFGEDKHSCYWGSNEAARDMLREHSARAIRFYKEDKGFARAWIIFPNTKSNVMVMFNAYGYTIETQSEVLANHLGMVSKEIGLRNNDNTGGMLYINNGQARAIGKAIPQTLTSINLDWDEPEQYEFNCESCGHGVPDGEGYNVGDYSYCERCYGRNFFRCAHCDESYGNDDAVVVDGESWCDGCASDDSTMCEICDENSRHTETIDGKEVCNDCRRNSNEVEICAICHELHLKETGHTHEEQNETQPA